MAMSGDGFECGEESKKSTDGSRGGAGGEKSKRRRKWLYLPHLRVRLLLLSVLTGRLRLVGPVAGALHLIEEEPLRTGKVEPLTFRAAVEHAAVVRVAEEALTRATEPVRRRLFHLFGLPVQRSLTRRAGWQWLWFLWQRFWLFVVGGLWLRFWFRFWFRLLFVVVGSQFVGRRNVALSGCNLLLLLFGRLCWR